MVAEDQAARVDKRKSEAAAWLQQDQDQPDTSQATEDPATGDDNNTFEGDASDSALHDARASISLHACKSSTLPRRPSLRKPGSPQCHLLRIRAVVQAALTARLIAGAPPSASSDAPLPSSTVSRADARVSPRRACVSLRLSLLVRARPCAARRAYRARRRAVRVVARREQNGTHRGRGQCFCDWPPTFHIGFWRWKVGQRERRRLILLLMARSRLRSMGPLMGTMGSHRQVGDCLSR